MKIRELESLVIQHGWVLRPRTGTNHRHWVKGNERITISGNPSRESDRGQENAVLRRLGLK